MKQGSVMTPAAHPTCSSVLRQRAGPCVLRHWKTVRRTKHRADTRAVVPSSFTPSSPILLPHRHSKGFQAGQGVTM